MKEFKGRVITARDWSGKAVVSKNIVNSMTLYYDSIFKKRKNIVALDHNNPDLYGKVLTGKALCLPVGSPSSNTSLIIQAICERKVNPDAYLFSEHIDSMSASGIILAKVWEESDIICIDQLGGEFLESVKTDSDIIIKADGTVIINEE